jgi:DNA mismatch repair ATPase MutL
VAPSDIAKCPSCHNPYKEISEDEYKEKKKKLKERKNQRENQNENERRRQRDNSTLHSSRLNINNDNNNFSNNNNNNIHHHGNRINTNNNNNNYNRNQHERRDNNHHQHRHGGRRHQNQRDNSTDRINGNPNNVFSNFFGNMFQPFGTFGDQFFANGLNNPFRVVIQRQNVPNDIFDPVFSTFGSMFNGAFQDNFSSNFRTNFRGNFVNEMLRILENNRAEARRNAHPPTSEENLKKLKTFNMNEKYCKKDKDGNYELPNCCICLSEIAKGEKTILLPCGHMFHYECCMTWLKKNNTCPMCRFEIK